MSAAVRDCPAFHAGDASGAPHEGHASWRGSIELRYERRDARTALAHNRHAGPLRVQRPLYPEGEACCHTILVHPPGGIAGGDEISIAVEVGDGAAALVTTPGAGKWYRGFGRPARSEMALRVGARSTLEWLPQESIVFSGALARCRTHLDVHADGALVWWEVVCLGRPASGERFAEGALRSALDLRVGGESVFVERAVIEAGGQLLDSQVGLAGTDVFGTLLAYSPDRSGDSLPGRVRRARGCAWSEGVRGGITSAGPVLIARAMGPNAEAVRGDLERVWCALRESLVGRAAHRPRIWNT